MAHSLAFAAAISFSPAAGRRRLSSQVPFLDWLLFGLGVIRDLVGYFVIDSIRSFCLHLGGVFAIHEVLRWLLCVSYMLLAALVGWMFSWFDSIAWYD